MGAWLVSVLILYGRTIFNFCLLASFSLLLAPSIAHAFDISPTVTMLELPRDLGGVTLNVRNPRTVNLPVEFEMYERDVNEDGSEELTPADDMFLIFPPQAVIEPGSNQSVRVQWLGAVPEQSHSFTLFASEIPVDMETMEGPTIQTIFRMGASLHISTVETKPDPTLLSSEATTEGVRLTLGNSGNRFYYIDALALEFPGKRLSGIELADIAGRTLVTPGAKRTFTVPDVTGTPVLKLLE